MNNFQHTTKITEQHRSRKAIVYLRQSSPRQVVENQQSQRLQYAMADRARQLGFEHIETIDCDLGRSASLGAGPRAGFDSVLSAVAQGEVGIVLSREVSRLSRTDSDWCQLIGVCQVFGTLIGDEEQIYDLSLLDDQLVLGIKGTMSVVELNVLKMRMLRGQEEKARRGELFKRLPSGYVLDLDGHAVKTPDRRVQEAVELVFGKFRQLWSIRQTFMWFRDHDVQLPVNAIRGHRELHWQIPTQSFVREILVNPFYAGAYVWGRRTTETVLIDGVLKKRQGALRRAEECRVFIPEHHEGYIDWQTYSENQKTIRGNSVKWESDESVSAVREGQNLLTGLLRCGRCGRKLHVRYWGKRGTAARYLCKGDFDSGGEYCLGFGGRFVDRRVSEEILKVISPSGVEASLNAIDRLSSSGDEHSDALVRQLEQLEYEAQRAFEQYDAVDARNRLAAAELEQRWNAKLKHVEQIRSSIAELERTRPEITDVDRDILLAMGERFQDLWNSKQCCGVLKKKIARTVIEEIVVTDVDDHTLHFVIHWKGGVHTEITMPRPASGTAQKTSLDALDIIRKMATRFGDNQIASVLTQHGYRTGKAKRWNQARVKTARRNHSIAGQMRAQSNPDILSLTQAAKYCSVSNKSIERLVECGQLTMQQVVPRAPWEIQKTDLDSDPVRSILEHLRKTGKLIIDGGGSDRQQSLPIEI